MSASSSPSSSGEGIITLQRSVSSNEPAHENHMDAVKALRRVSSSLYCGGDFELGEQTKTGQCCIENSISEDTYMCNGEEHQIAREPIEEEGLGEEGEAAVRERANEKEEEGGSREEERDDVNSNDRVCIDNEPSPLAKKRRQLKKQVIPTAPLRYPLSCPHHMPFVCGKHPMEGIVRLTGDSLKLTICSQKNPAWLKFPIHMSFCLELRHAKRPLWKACGEGVCSDPGTECCSIDIPKAVAEQYVVREMLELHLSLNS